MLNSTAINSILISVLLIFSTVVCAQTQLEKDTSQPNIVLILTDDQGWGDVAYNGNNLIDTPNIDGIAKQGATFSRFYVNPVCAPTRASLLTGRYSLRTGVHNVTRGEEAMRAEEVTLAEVLADKGYATGAFGKWHNGAYFPNTPLGQGFDEFVGFTAGHWSEYFDTELEFNGVMKKTSGYITDVLTDAAIDFIRKQKDKPFLAYIPYNAPHSPYQVPDTYFEKYKARGLNDRTASIYGMVENIDTNIGRVLSELDSLGLSDNTIIVFLSDNGPHQSENVGGRRYNGGMRAGKGSVHEGGVRVPLYIHWPNHIEGGKVVQDIAQHIDLFPTLLNLTDVDVPQNLDIDGIDLTTLLTSAKTELPSRMLYTHRWSMGEVVPSPGAVRTQQWLATLEEGSWSLYDVVNDSEEQHNLATEYPAQLEKMSKAYFSWFEDVTSAGFDPIPADIGHKGYPVVMLEGANAYLTGTGIGYAGGNGWAHSWVTNWIDPEAYMTWHINVVDAGAYSLSMRYALNEDAKGMIVRVEIGDQHIDTKITKSHKRKALPASDRAPRYSVFEQTWATVDLGSINLPKGKEELHIKILSNPGTQGIEVKDLSMTKL